MKLINKKLLVFIYLYLILNSHVISIQSKIHRIKSFKSRNKLIDPESCEKVEDETDDTDQNFDFQAFFLAFLTSTDFSVLPKIADIFSKINEAPDKDCVNYDSFKSTYYKILKCKQEKIDSSMTGASEMINNLKSSMGKSELEEIQALKEKPKLMCEKVVLMTDSKKTHYDYAAKDNDDVIERMYKYIDQNLDIKTMKMFYSVVNYKILKLIGADKDPTLEDKEKFHSKLREFIDLLNESSKVYRQKLKELQKNTPNCQDLPDTLETINQIGLIRRVRAIIQTIGIYSNCSIFGNTLKKLWDKVLGMGIEAAFRVIGDIAGLWVVKLIKVIWNSSKMIFYIYKAIKATKVKEKSEMWGNAAGTGVKIILIVLGIERKRIKKLK